MPAGARKSCIPCGKMFGTSTGTAQIRGASIDATHRKRRGQQPMLARGMGQKWQSQSFDRVLRFADLEQASLQA